MYGVDDERKPWRAVCTALEYLKANGPELTNITGSFTNGAGGAVTNPCANLTLLNQTCVPTPADPSHATWARWDTTLGATINVQIRSGYALPDPAFPEDQALVGDNGGASDAGCDQLAIIIRESRSPGLGSLASDEDMVTEVRSVGRASPATSGQLIPALLLLERTGCNVLTVGGNPSVIDVRGTGIAPGSIHVDSDATTCSSGDKIIMGRFARHVVARPADLGTPRLPGLITTVAGLGTLAAMATDGSTNTCAETAALACNAATGRALVGRRVADVRYLTGVTSAISTAGTYYNATTAALAPGGASAYTELNTCSPATNTTSLPVFVRCPAGVSINGSVTFANSPSVTFNGPLEIKPSGTLSAPKATRLYVRGRTGTSTPAGLANSGNLYLNNVSGATACSGLTAAPRAQLVVGNGPLSGGSQATFHLCHTTVLMADNSGTPTCALPTVFGTAPHHQRVSGQHLGGSRGDVGLDRPQPDHHPFVHQRRVQHLPRGPRVLDRDIERELAGRRRHGGSLRHLLRAQRQPVHHERGDEPDQRHERTVHRALAGGQRTGLAHAAARSPQLDLTASPTGLRPGPLIRPGVGSRLIRLSEIHRPSAPLGAQASFTPAGSCQGEKRWTPTATSAGLRTIDTRTPPWDARPSP